jgi:Flp pilus assembly protein TadD
MESWKLNDQDGETAHSLGVLQGIQGRPAEALPWFEKAVALTPDNKLYRENLAKSYYAVGNKAKGDEQMLLIK